MVAKVGGEEHVRMQPSEKGDNPHEKSVQELGPKNKAVAELVHGVDEEIGLGAVEARKQRCGGRKLVRGAGVPHGQGGGGDKKGKPWCGLHEALQDMGHATEHRVAEGRANAGLCMPLSPRPREPAARAWGLRACGTMKWKRWAAASVSSVHPSLRDRRIWGGGSGSVAAFCGVDAGPGGGGAGGGGGGAAF